MDYQGKKVLFIVTEMNSMENEIIGALENAGAQVDFYNDPLELMNSQESERNKYWENKLSSFKVYDILIWIDGYSFSPIVIDFLCKQNPNIFKILYLWDDLEYFDWRYEFKYFDRISSFDENDCKKNGLNYLPLYWVSYEKLHVKKTFDISYIGAFSNDRVELIDNLLPHFKDLNYKINLVRPEGQGLKYQFRKIVKTVLGLNKGEIKRDYILKKGIDKDEFDRITCASKCVLDIVKLTQTGYTNRSMQTIGNGIKLISTNANLKNAPFYDPKMIYILDRNDINIKEIEEFMSLDVETYKNDYLSKLELSSWIHRL